MHSPTKILSRREQALISAVSNAFFPPGGPIPLSGTDAGTVPYIAGYVGRADGRTRFLMRLLFAFADMSPFVFGSRKRRFVRLSRAEQIKHLDEAFTSDIYFRRVSFVSLRALMTMAYLANPSVVSTIKMRQDADPFNLGPLSDHDMGRSVGDPGEQLAEDAAGHLAGHPAAGHPAGRGCGDRKGTASIPAEAF